jgi:hypothetical protein
MGDAWSAKTWAALEESAARQFAGPAATVAATTEATATSAPPHAEESRNGAGASSRGAFLRRGGVRTMPQHSDEANAPASAFQVVPAADGVAPPQPLDLELEDVKPAPEELSPPDGVPARAQAVQEDSPTFAHGGDVHGEGDGDLVHGLLPPEYPKKASRELTSLSISSSCSSYASAIFCGNHNSSCGKGCSAAFSCSICLCSAGHYSAYGSAAANSACPACSAGQYRSTTGATSCVSCPTGQYNPYKAQTGCYSCPSGQSQPYSNYSATSCFTSTGTSLSVTDSAWCGTVSTGCGIGCSHTYAATCTVYECIPGYYLAYGYTTTQTTGCTACSAGYYGTTFQATSCSTACGSGTYSSKGASSCTSCPTGQYNAATAKSSCTSCPGGQYQNVAAQTGCKGCPGGHYCPAGSSGYKACPGG